MHVRLLLGTPLLFTMHVRLPADQPSVCVRGNAVLLVFAVCILVPQLSYTNYTAGTEIRRHIPFRLMQL